MAKMELKPNWSVVNTYNSVTIEKNVPDIVDEYR